MNEQEKENLRETAEVTAFGICGVFSMVAQIGYVAMGGELSENHSMVGVSFVAGYLGASFVWVSCESYDFVARTGKKLFAKPT